MGLAFIGIGALAAAGAAGRAFADRVVPGLTDDTKRALAALLVALAAAGIRVKVGSAGRSRAGQALALEQGRTATSSSLHEQGRAVDLYPIGSGGFPDMNGTDLDLFRRMHQIAAGLGWHGIAFNVDGSRRYLTNAQGRKFWDGGHLEWKGAVS